MALRQFTTFMAHGVRSSMNTLRGFSTAAAVRFNPDRTFAPVGGYGVSVAAKTSHELPAQQRRNEESASDPPQAHPSHSSLSQSEQVRLQSERSPEGVKGPFGEPPSNRSSDSSGGGFSASASSNRQRSSSGGKYGSTTGAYGSGGNSSSNQRSGGRDRDDDGNHKHDDSSDSVTEKVQEAYETVKDKVQDVLGTGHSSTSKIASQQSGGAQRIASPSNPLKPPQKKTPTTVKNK